MRMPGRLWLAGFLSMTVVSPLYGQKPGKPFVSPLKNFSVTVPNFPFGTQVQKWNNRDGGHVVFIGGLGDLQRIDYVRIQAGSLAEQDSTARLASYQSSLDGMVSANRAEVMVREPLTAAGDPMLYALVRFPEASQIVEGASGKRRDSYRSMLVLARGEFLYVLSVDIGTVFNLNQPQEEPQEKGKQSVQRLMEKITFQGSAIPLVGETTGSSPAATGAGQIVFSSTRDGNYEIYVVNADGSHPARLTDHPAEDRFPTWSPDGTRIVFHSNRDGNWEICIVKAEGSGLVNVTGHEATDVEPQWRPRSSR